MRTMNCRRRAGPWRGAAAIVLLAGAAGCAAPEPPPTLALEDILAIRHPASPVWTPDGERVIFVWDQNQQMDLYQVTPGSGEPPRPLTRWGDSYEEISGLFWGPEGVILHFVRNGTLYRMNPEVPGTLERVFADEPGGESGFAPSPDLRQLAFIRSGDLFVRDLADGPELQLTRTGDRVESGPGWSPDGRFIDHPVSR